MLILLLKKYSLCVEEIEVIGCQHQHDIYLSLLALVVKLVIRTASRHWWKLLDSSA